MLLSEKVKNPSVERRGRTPKHARFRAGVDELTTLAAALPDNPSQTDLEPLRQLAMSLQAELMGDAELEHRMRNIVTVTSLSRDLASAGEALEWIKVSARGPLPKK